LNAVRLRHLDGRTVAGIDRPLFYKDTRIFFDDAKKNGDALVATIDGIV
jgi:NAD/NADP transhydrogenase beta subunit